MKYPKIFTDRTKNTPADIVHAEQNYDFMHHTHKISELVDDVGIGGGTGESGAGVDGKSAYEVWLSLGNTGTEQDFINSLKGADGKDGTDGLDGKDGKSAYETWLDLGNTGSEQDFIDSLKGKDGSDGKDGIDGKNGTDGLNGKDGADGKDGTNGLDGKSAYEVWLSLGNTGTEQDFINSLKGADGNNGVDGKDGLNGLDGKDGKSAYEVWLSLGNTGTEEEFINYLKSDSSVYDDTALIQRIADLESRPQIYVSSTQPENLKNGDFWIEG